MHTYPKGEEPTVHLKLPVVSSCFILAPSCLGVTPMSLFSLCCILALLKISFFHIYLYC